MKIIFSLLLLASPAWAEIDMSVEPSQPVVIESDFVTGPTEEDIKINGSWFNVTPRLHNNTKQEVEISMTSMEVIDSQGKIIYQAVRSDKIKLAPGENYSGTSYFVTMLPKSTFEFQAKFTVTGSIADKELGSIKNFGKSIEFKTQ